MITTPLLAVDLTPITPQIEALADHYSLKLIQRTVRRAVDRILIEQAMTQVGNNRAAAARRVGLSGRALHYKLHQNRVPAGEPEK